jgi:hypothetical protein
MLRVLRSKTLNINSVADLDENSCATMPTFFSIYLLTFKTVSTVLSIWDSVIHKTPVIGSVSDRTQI